MAFWVSGMLGTSVPFYNRNELTNHREIGSLIGDSTYECYCLESWSTDHHYASFTTVLAFVLNNSFKKSQDYNFFRYSASVPVSRICRDDCHCRRLYEENLELYQDMLNSLNEMRAVVSDLKCSSGMDTGYYVDEGDVLEEADGDEIYVVD